MKKKYIIPETEISVFDTEDIITVSGEMTPIDNPGGWDVYSPIFWEDEVDG